MAAKPLKLTNAEIEALKSRKGGFTRKALASVGVPWPAPKGWRKALLAGKPIPHPNGHQRVKTSLPKPSADHDPHVLLRQVVLAVINAGHASDLNEFPELIEYFTTRRAAQPSQPDIHDLADYSASLNVGD